MYLIESGLPAFVKTLKENSGIMGFLKPGGVQKALFFARIYSVYAFTKLKLCFEFLLLIPFNEKLFCNDVQL